MTTIGDILNEERFSKLKVINSNANLQREVSTIESTETPDISLYLQQDAFLLTTGMVYKDNQTGLCDLIEQLNKLPCAALGIKLGRYIYKCDDEVIETANRLGFPLIQIPQDMTLGSIFHLLLSYMWDNKNEQLLYALNVQHKFSNLMMKGASINALIKNLGHTLDRPVALVDPFGNINSSTDNLTKQYYKESIREIIGKMQKNKNINIDISRKVMDSSNREVIVSINPIKVANYYPYYLLVFKPENLPFQLTKMAIEQAVLILAFTLYKNLRISYNLLSSKEEFLKNLIDFENHGSLFDNQLFLGGSKYGLTSSKSYRIIIASIENNDKHIKNINFREEWYSLIYDLLEKKLIKDIKESILFPDKENYNFVILLQDESIKFEEILIQYRDVLRKTLELNMNFAVGNKVLELDAIKYSHKEATEALINGETKDDISFIKYYKTLSVTELLKFIPKSQMKAFCIYTLKSLAYPENESQDELRKTLKTYLDFNCDITKTAVELFVHRNTVKYRIKKCEDILGQDIKDPIFGFKLRLSLILNLH